MTQSPDYEQNELKAAFAREAQRLAPYHRQKRIAALASIGTVFVLWLGYFGFFLLLLGDIPLKLTIAVVVGTIALGAVVHKKLSPRNPFTGE